ncbi:indolepyruvate ferredoxin oxidoreductase family protein [Azospirillum thermophilum]|uniref:Indolepyruvate ferredoxin oxidoreductase family protein n=1 Tax=Azospirillum thermophilum TaxID=2202148 RepID=A0A2S2CRR2_9PROT|nr:indolepyruvate ferredoxin oxidoreductase family protein [Azospirillum thermophilum]AWK87172.1 indolepyruvate ferredoxin oxidoreductase family protein [Azospirillum thermophilum]
MALATVSLDDKYALEQGRVYLTGTQALVRLPMMQRQRDLAAGLNTGCFISGYRGSPLGGFDQNLWNARKFLEKNHIRFQPGVNEELGATAVWGSQQVGMFPGARYDGVFAMWYGKGPGVDRSGDVFKHANAAGTSRNGGVLVLTGDDHNAKSSTFPHQSEHAFMHAMIPVLNPSGVQEILDYGLIGWAMSRYSGCWIAMKTIAETVDTSASVYIDPHRVSPLAPTDFPIPQGGLNIRWPDPPLEQEYRLMKHKLYAALAFARANKLDKVMLESARPRFGIVTTGKSYLDVRQAFDELGITEEMAADWGITVYKVGMPWPLERDGVRHFAEGLEEIVVVEEKRAVIENQLKEQLYNWHPDVRPRVVGKFDEEGEWILPSAGELSPAQIAVVIGRRLERFVDNENLKRRVAFLDAQERQKAHQARVIRKPTFCSGCPHNTSTVVPDGSRALGGIGCHYMATWLDRKTDTFTQMGGEGVPWVGQAAFTEEQHIFANLGDGTYYHSGILAIRQAIAAKVNITYKILFNDAVAMTGGQPVDGTLTVQSLAAQLRAEGVQRIVVVSDEPEKYGVGSGLPQYTTVEHRDDLDRVQKEMREVGGVSVLIYDQTCATEKRRRRKRGKMVDPARRVVINELVCEGCGDCSAKSSCVSVVPLETEFGRKRQIDQSSCNKDYSCTKGFCPSFVTVEGGQLRKPKPAAKAVDSAPLPAPALPALDGKPWSIYVTGVGGTGVVTIGALIGMAAHIEGKGVGVLDMTGLAQKGGAVTSHIRIAPTPEDIHSVRIAAGGADAVLGCDIVVAAAGDGLSKMTAGRTRAIINTHDTITADFIKKPDMVIPVRDLVGDIRKACGGDQSVDAFDATRLATALLGDSIYANPFLMGYAWQKGLIPLSEDAILKAIELNGVSVRLNSDAFQWGRRAAVDLAAVEALAAPAPVAQDGSFIIDQRRPSQSLDEIIERRTRFLTDYQDAAYAARYHALVDWTRRIEQQKVPGSTALTEAVARAHFKLMAYKDEYEVARLYTDTGFVENVARMFEGDWKLTFHMAPPVMGETDETGGEPRKKTFGPWMLRFLKILAKGKRLRGTALDPFGRLAERKLERRLIEEYEGVMGEVLHTLTRDNHALAVEIAGLPMEMRGYGHIKTRNVEAAKAKEAKLLQAYRQPARPQPMAAE